MAAFVINRVNTFIRLLILVTLISIYSCENKTIPVSQLNITTWKGDEHNATFKLTMKGEIRCPTTLVIFIDDFPQDSIVFEGIKDTIILDDLYENKLSFKIEPVECIKEGSDAEVKLN